MWRIETAGSSIIYANAKWLKQEETDVYFRLTKYEWKQEIVVKERAWGINWILQKVETWGYNWTDAHGNEKFKKTMTFTFVDWDETIKFWIGYNKISRGIILALASCEKICGTTQFELRVSKKWSKYCRVTVNWADVKSTFDYEKDVKSKQTYSEQYEKVDYTKEDEWIDTELIPLINSRIDTDKFAAIETESNFGDRSVEELTATNDKTEVAETKGESKDDIDNSLPF